MVGSGVPPGPVGEMACLICRFAKDAFLSLSSSVPHPTADYSCALQRDILLQGRLYLSENWICFYSNIFRWETLVKTWGLLTGLSPWLGLGKLLPLFPLFVDFLYPHLCIIPKSTLPKSGGIDLLCHVFPCTTPPGLGCGREQESICFWQMQVSIRQGSLQKVENG